MCPECGALAAKMTQNLVNGDIVYTCAVGHEWVSDEGKAQPASPAKAEEKQAGSVGARRGSAGRTEGAGEGDDVAMAML